MAIYCSSVIFNRGCERGSEAEKLVPVPFIDGMQDICTLRGRGKSCGFFTGGLFFDLAFGPLICKAVAHVMDRVQARFEGKDAIRK